MAERTVTRSIYRVLYPGINTRVTGPFLIIVALIAGIGVFIVTRLVAGSLQERFSNQLLDSARAASSTLADIEREQLATLRLMVFTDGVPAAMEADDAEQLQVWLEPIAANAGLDDLILFDRAGNGILRLSRLDSLGGIQYSTLPPPETVDWPGVSSVLTSTTDTQGDKFVDLIGSYPDTLLYISAPVKTADGQVVGGMAVGISTARLARLISEQSLSAVVLYAPNGQVMGSTFRLVDSGLLVLKTDQAADLELLVKQETPVEEIDLNGTPYQILYTSLQVRGRAVGLLGVGLPTNYIVERIGTSRDTFGILFAALFVFVGGAGLLIARSITRPVTRLVDTTRAIRTGDLSRRVGMQTPDELGELAKSFDHMTDQLVARNQEIRDLYLQQVEATAQREAMLTSIGDAIIVQDPEGYTLLRNPSAGKLIKSVSQNQKLHAAFIRLCSHPEVLTQPRTLQLANRYYSVLATPVQLPSGDLLGHVIVFHDIDDIVRAENLKDEMILQMSHELRTPLTAARGYVDLVKNLDPNLSAQSHTFVQNTLDNLTVLERMVNEVIDVSAIISKRFAINVRRVNLAELLTESVGGWRTAVERRELTLNLMVPQADLWIEGDYSYLTQVLDHLMRNAYSYTLPGGTIEVYAAVTGQHATIYVQDNGVGIASDELPLVFERLYRGGSAEAGPTDSRGLGLGLYLSKHIVEAHHGYIHLDSKPNFGTVVTVVLPVKQDGVR